MLSQFIYKYRMGIEIAEIHFDVLDLEAKLFSKLDQRHSQIIDLQSIHESELCSFEWVRALGISLGMVGVEGFEGGVPGGKESFLGFQFARADCRYDLWFKKTWF